MTKKRLAEHNVCTGCGLCASVCPKEAISMERDRGGFLYPRLDGSKCIDCFRCTDLCHVKQISKNNRLNAYYGWHKDSIIRENSSSGGAFTALAQAVFEAGGVVYGHVINFNTLLTYCTKAVKEDQLVQMRQSKYVESDITGIYSQIANDLIKRIVMFCGTPCQCAALRKRFGNHENLLLVSFVCHGVGAPSLFQEHYSSICKNKEIEEFRMRDKSFGWHDDTLRIKFFGHKKDVLKHYYADEYYYGYMALSMFLRDCCYSCNYSDKHCSDITIADYWNIVNTAYYDDNKGVSMIIANSNIGNRIIGRIKNVELHELSLSECEYAFFGCASPNSLAVVEKITKKNEFLSDCDKDGFKKSARKRITNIPLRRIKVIIKWIKRKATLK